jgi:sugar/nucleoside kinase (ribokinase family)
MFEIDYKCMTREQWYYDSTQPSFEAAVRRATAIHNQTGRAVVITFNDSPVWSVAQVNKGQASPVSPEWSSYLD